MSKSNYESNKSKGGLKVFWIPTRSHRKSHQTRSNYNVHSNYKLLPSVNMSGSSPHADLFDLKDRSSSPPPTTSKDVVVHNTTSALPTTEFRTDVVATTALAEPLKEHGPGTNLCGFIDNTKNYSTDDHISEEEPLRGNRPEAGDHKQHNGDADKLDGKWALPMPTPSLKKVENDENDEDCTVKCLYYTMQCCDCSIM